MYHQDWIMRQITSFIHMIGKVLFKKDSVELNIHSESNSEKSSSIIRKVNKP